MHLKRQIRLRKIIPGYSPLAANGSNYQRTTTNTLFPLDSERQNLPCYNKDYLIRSIGKALAFLRSPAANWFTTAGLTEAPPTLQKRSTEPSTLANSSAFLKMTSPCLSIGVRGCTLTPCSSELTIAGS